MGDVDSIRQNIDAINAKLDRMPTKRQVVVATLCIWVVAAVLIIGSYTLTH